MKSINHRKRGGSYSFRKGAFALIYFLAMGLYLFRPLIPFLEYSINKSYISRNLCINRSVPGECCNGKCYLHVQLKKFSDYSDSEKNNSKKLVREKGPDDHLKTEVSLSEPFASFSPSSKLYILVFKDYFTTSVFVPPKL